MCGKKTEDLARKYKAGEALSLCDISHLIRNKDELPEQMQAALEKEATQEDYYRPLSKSKLRKLRKRQHQAR